MNTPEGKINKSERIRQLHDAGMTVADIARVIGVRYQYAYNVVSHHLASKALEVVHNDSGRNSDPGVRLSTVAVG